MDTGSMFGFMDIIVLGCGVYGIYSWYMLVKKQEIKKAFLLGGDSRVEECTDFQGFADCIGSKLLIVSIAMIVFGAVSAVNDYVQSLGAVIWIALVVSLGYWSGTVYSFAKQIRCILRKALPLEVPLKTKH